MIFYFTATGNSKYAAQLIAQKTGDTNLIDIADCVKAGKFSFSLDKGESVGFVVPVYFYIVPAIVSEFVGKLSIIYQENYYSYVVLNAGGTAADAARNITKAIRIDAVFAVPMVDNYVMLSSIKPKAEIEELLDRAKESLAQIADKINSREAGDFNGIKGFMPRFMSFVAAPMYELARTTGKFKVDESKCASCGLCSEICPRNTIEIIDGKPVWKTGKCEQCLGCLHRCPSSAIDFGKSEGRGRYTNPRVELP
ncbi:MAG: EFR1 family ferrodoxin [Eubacteriaceae bacterium]|nr:EFR1 family ferrodoxin [Eubacteriaceae bacterium]